MKKETWKLVIQVLISILTAIATSVMKKETWKLVIQVLISILTAIATSVGVSSCIGL